LAIGITFACTCACELPPVYWDHGGHPTPHLDSGTGFVPDAGDVLDAHFEFSTDTYLDFDPWRFAAMADSMADAETSAPQILEEIVDEIMTHDVDLLIFAGDLVTGGGNDDLVLQLGTWREIMLPLYSTGVEVYPVRGNHEVGSIDAWNAIFTGVYALPDNGPEDEVGLTYTVEHKNALFLAFDAYVDYNEVNQPWVEYELATNHAPHVIAYAHPPAYPAYPKSSLADHPYERDEFWESLIEAGAKLYFCGHTHFFNHARLDDSDGDPDDDVHQLTVGTAGAGASLINPNFEGENGEMIPVPVFHAAAYGFTIVEINGLHASLTFWKREEPEVFTARHYWTYSLE
jgi:hypothetical protein